MLLGLITLLGLWGLGAAVMAFVSPPEWLATWRKKADEERLRARVRPRRRFVETERD